jgi:hypothetical protein
MSRLDEFIIMVKRIEKLTDASKFSLRECASRIPDSRAEDVSDVIFDYRNVKQPSIPRIKELMERRRATAMACERIRGEQERDILLTQYALELEALRAVLPTLAAQVAIQIGVIAREMMP